MKIVTFSTGGAPRVGVVLQGRVHDVGSIAPGGTREIVERWDDHGPLLRHEARSQPSHPIADVRLHAPFPEPRRDLFCVGRNYRDHPAEFGLSGYDGRRSADLPTDPVVFAKATTAVTGPYDDVLAHEGLTAALDYEAELAVVIGHGGRGVTREAAFDHVWGYTVVNDVTARDLQSRHQQWLLGKSLDTHCPMGPYLVSADEVSDVDVLHIESRVNGELRQSASVRDLVFDIPDLIATISQGITLLPGDIIATGTPAGVGLGFDPPRFLRPGDVMEVSITGLGRQRNTIC